MVKPEREYVEFPVPDEAGWSYRFDVTFMASTWRCIYGDGCGGIVRPRRRSHEGHDRRHERTKQSAASQQVVGTGHRSFHATERRPRSLQPSMKPR